ncbi:hypothetical protein MMC06_000648 [Schaereria dolodes]|nr:hypothetical protein [Schaereria dolodes]
MPPKPPLTHFLCLPLVTPSSRPQLQNSLHQFTTDVTIPSNETSTPIPANVVRPLGTLHLTLGVMTLVTQERVDAALAFLHSLKIHELLLSAGSATTAVEEPPFRSRSAVEPAKIETVQVAVPATSTPLSVDSARLGILPLTINLSGLSPMHRPSSTSILYTTPQDPTSRLYPFCLALQTAFTSAELLFPESRLLLLHATIINTIYAKDRKSRYKGGGHGKDRKGTRFIDATELLRKYAGFVWAEDVKLERVSICEMGAKKIISKGLVVGEEYNEIGSVPLP